MPNEQLEHISIITEIFAFFFVTVDLYGKHRLESLRNKIRALKIEKIQKESDLSKLITKITVFFLIVIFVILVFTIISIIKNISNYQHSGNDLTSLILAIFLTLSLLMIRKVFSSFTRFIFYKSRVFVKKIFLILLSLIIHMVNLFPIEGFMLTFGAVLFVIAKLMAYYAV